MPIWRTSFRFVDSRQPDLLKGGLRSHSLEFCGTLVGLGVSPEPFLFVPLAVSRSACPGTLLFSESGSLYATFKRRYTHSRKSDAYRVSQKFCNITLFAFSVFTRNAMILLVDLHC